MATAPQHIYRLARAGLALTRAGLPRVMGVPDDAPWFVRWFVDELAPDPEPDIARLSDTLTRLGPTYIKLGQFMATRPDVIGSRAANGLSELQDNLEPFAKAEAEAQIEAAFKAPVRDVFKSFGPPVAAASIAQVHKATPAGDSASGDVAVKVLRPGIEHRFRGELQSFYFAARLVERLHAPSRRLKLVEVVETLDRSVELEMDLRLEAAALSEMAENMADDPDFQVPAVDWTRTARRVLTTEWIDGIPLGHHDRLLDQGHDLKRLGRIVIQSFLRQALNHGFFHADLHPGNLFVDEDGRLVAVDFGIVGRLGMAERRFLAEILWGLISRDYKRTSEVHFEAGYVPPRHTVAEFAQALRSIGEPLAGRSAEDISMARVLTQLFEVTEQFDMATRPELLLLQKTMVVAEGVARSLDPDLNMWTTAEPIVRDWMEKRLSPESRIQDAAEGAASIGRLVAGLPEFLDQAEKASLALATLARQAEGEAENRERTSSGEGVSRELLWFGLGVLFMVLMIQFW